RRRHLDAVAFLFVEERASKRRRGRDETFGGVGILRHDELEDLFFAVLEDVERRSEAGPVARYLVDVEQRDLRHAFLQHADARFDEPLAFFRRLVFGVLAKIAELARA